MKYTNNKRDSFFLKIAWDVILVYLLICFFGIVNIYSSSCANIDLGIFSSGTYSNKQAIYLAMCLVMGFFILLLDGNFYQRVAYVAYAITTLMLVMVLFFGREVNGAKSWFFFGGFALQVAEFAKYGTSLAVSRFLGDNGFYKTSLKKKITLFAIAFFPIPLIMLQPDLGSAMVFMAFIFPIFREGLSMSLVICLLYFVIIAVLSLVVNNFILLGVILILFLLIYFFTRKDKAIARDLVLLFVVSVAINVGADFMLNNVLAPHQRDRVEVLLGIKEDKFGVGYNINQSKIAIGSGSLTGKGFYEGTQTKMDFVPESHTDFIFCTVGEEWGFLGCLTLILLYLYLFIRMIFMAERQRTRFSRVFGYAVVGILFLHVLINISMTIGFFPVVGIPLPFMSYGGSSLLGFSLLLFTFVKLDAYRYNVL